MIIELELKRLMDEITRLKSEIRTLQAAISQGQQSYDSTVNIANYSHTHKPSSILSGTCSANINFTGTIQKNASDILAKSDVDDTPVDAATDVPVSSNWAYDHKADASAHHSKTTSGEIDHDLILNTHNLTTDIDHDALTNFVAAEHVALPNTIANVLSDHDAAAHNALSIDHTSLSNIGSNSHATIDTHLASTSNPHNVTIAQIGAAASSHTHVEADITDLQSYLLDITGESIGDLSDVDLTGIADTKILKYNSTSGKWEIADDDTGGVSDHGALTGLADDDHTQYLLANGSRALTGDLNINGYDVEKAGTVYHADTTKYLVRISSDGLDSGTLYDIGLYWDTTNNYLHLRGYTQLRLDVQTTNIMYATTTAVDFVKPIDMNTQNISNVNALTAVSLKGDLGVTITEFSSDGTMSGNSDSAVPTEKAVVTYIANNQYDLLGSANARYVLTSDQGTSTTSKVYSARTTVFRNESTSGYNHYFVLSGYPATLGGKKLYLAAIKVGITDGDASNYLDYVNIYGYTYNGAATTLYSNATNRTTSVELDFTDIDASGYDVIQVRYAIVCNTIGAFDYKHPLLKIYYA